MRSDLSRLSFNEPDHFLGVVHQMGRVPLEADWNEQNELMLRLMQRFAGDAVHTGSPNNGFRVDTRLLLDACERRDGWTAAPAAATVFVDYFDHRVGDGSLVVAGATAIVKKLAAPVDLTGLVEVIIHVQGVFAAANLVFKAGDGTNTHAFTMSELAAESGWRVFRAVPGAWPTGFAAAKVVEYGFDNLDTTARYSFDSLRIDRPVYSPLLRTDLTKQFSATPSTAVLAPDDDARIHASVGLKVSGATQLSFALTAPGDLSRARALLVPIRRSNAAAAFTVTLVDAAAVVHSVALSAPVTTSVGGWELLRFALPQAGTFEWHNVAALRLDGLTATETYWLGSVLLEVNPASDLLIMGGDGTAAGAGRFYGDGLAATKEAPDSYLTQADLPLADPTALAPVAEGNHRIDWAYLDLWERPVSFIERPRLREIALEGQDTCARTQLVAQVRLLQGVAVPLAGDATSPASAFEQLPRLGGGTLTTKDKPAATLDPCADPCEPEVDGPYLGEGDRLFRIEIHRSGSIGPAAVSGTAFAKWSRDNGAISCPLIEDAAASTTSVVVERPDLFAIGDLIEISDDLVELVTGPCEDRVDHRNHQRGELRRIETINLQTRRISWDNASAADPALHAALPRSALRAYHAKIIKWDGLFAVEPGDITIADGVVVEFGGADLICGDYWVFTTRVVDRSVERLIDAPARGIRHAYFPLAAILRRREMAGIEAISVEDLRPRFAALPSLDANRVAYDPGAGVGLIPDWEKIGTVQEAIDAIVHADLNADLRLHHKLLHGFGVVCGLKVRCAMDRTRVVLGKGYAIDCEGHTIHVAGDKAIDVVGLAASQGLLDGAGNGKVNLRIERSSTADADIEIEPHVAQGFWASVLEGTLIKSFYDDVILGYVNFFRNQFLPFPDSTLPLSAQHQRVLTIINLFWQWVNSSSGPYMYVSPREHALLSQLYIDLRNLLASKTYCAMFDSLQPFPAYPYATANPGIDTLFGTWSFHWKLKLSPDGLFAYSYGFGNTIQVFDLTTREVVQVLEFPGGINATVMDVAFNAAGSELYVVALMSNSIDSVFATATIGAGQAHTWGPSTVVCDIKFVRLATHALRPNTLYAVGRSTTSAAARGLYTLVPNAISLAPVPAVNFNATGLIDISTDGATAYVAASTTATDTDNFDRVRYVNLTTLTTAVAAIVSGNEFNDDLKAHNNILYVTGVIPPSTAKNLHRFNAAGGLAGSTLLGASSPNRLAVLRSRNLIWISDADRYKVMEFNIGTSTLRANFRVPLQISTAALAVRADGSAVVALNFLSNTVNLVDVAAMEAGTPPTYTLELGNTLPAYRTAAIDAFTDLFGVFAQSMKDAFCDKFLIECQECTEKEQIYLGMVEIRNRQVFHICNFSKRHYVKSFKTWGWWLSTVPILPMIKKAFATLCCKII
jgi:hypothetical protein